jgi:CubicO group peptidase (beta-lactamase class C family)
MKRIGEVMGRPPQQDPWDAGAAPPTPKGGGGFYPNEHEQAEGAYRETIENGRRVGRLMLCRDSVTDEPIYPEPRGFNESHYDMLQRNERDRQTIKSRCRRSEPKRTFGGLDD